jgi:hypothetical protein
LPYQKPVDIVTLNLPSDPEYFVKIKGRIKWGGVSKAQTAMLKVDINSPELTDVEMGAYNNALIAAAIVEWNVTDEADAVLPITPESVEELEPEDGQFLLTEVTKRTKLRSAAAQHSFS